MVSVIVVNEWWYFLPYCYITGDAATLALCPVKEGGELLEDAIKTGGC